MAQLRLRPPKQIPPYARRTIASIKVKRFVERKGKKAQTVEVIEFRLWSKNEALEKLLKHAGDLVDKVALTDPTGKKEYGSSDIFSDESRLTRLLELLELGRARRLQALERNGQHDALASPAGPSDTGVPQRS